MRTQTREYFAKFLETHSKLKSTMLDVGSLSTQPGAHIKDIALKYNMDYLGVDMRKGDNVDIILNGHDLSTIDRQYDLVVSFDTFEHDDAFWLTLEEMKKVLKPGGWMMIGFPSRYCPQHDHPQDYWRFMPHAMEVMFRGFEDFEMIVDKNPESEMEDEIYGWGRKPKT